MTRVLGTALAVRPAAGQGKTPVTLLLNFYASNEHAPFAYGVVKGIFAEEGIGVNALTLGLIVNTRHAGDTALNCRMARATTRAWAAAVKDPDGAVDALHQLFPNANKGAKDLTREPWAETAQLLHTRHSKGKAPGWMAREDWEALLTPLKEQGGMERVKAPEAYYANDFIDCK